MKKLLAVLLTVVFCLAISGLAIAIEKVIEVGVENDVVSGSGELTIIEDEVSGSGELTCELGDVELIYPEPED